MGSKNNCGLYFLCLFIFDLFPCVGTFTGVHWVFSVHVV